MDSRPRDAAAPDGPRTRCLPMEVRWRVHGGLKPASERGKAQSCRDLPSSVSPLVMKGSAVRIRASASRRSRLSLQNEPFQLCMTATMAATECPWRTHRRVHGGFSYWVDASGSIQAESVILFPLDGHVEFRNARADSPRKSFVQAVSSRLGTAWMLILDAWLPLVPVTQSQRFLDVGSLLLADGVVPVMSPQRAAGDKHRRSGKLTERLGVAG
jgi:hypothetical protein